VGIQGRLIIGRLVIGPLEDTIVLFLTPCQTFQASRELARAGSIKPSPVSGETKPGIITEHVCSPPADGGLRGRGVRSRGCGAEAKGHTK
jgi:hypothetical protein